MGNKSKNWIGDLVAAISVSLVALPISLALAKASGVDPMAGVISSVVGGLVMFFLGGANITITGPGNGLVIVILSSVASLGFATTLTAIVVSGFLLIILGFLKFGNLSDFFPSSSIQGLLTAIGLTLIIKQLKFMLGVNIEMPIGISTIEAVLYIPDMIRAFVADFSSNWSGILGVLSLFILATYGQIKHPVVKLMPAPMWVVLMGIGFYYYFEWTQQSFPILPTDLLFVDPNQLKEFNLPAVDNIVNADFVFTVIAITLICLIESLLSVKAIDKIDPLKRRSNYNKDLKGLGVASILSGLLGGLPVVTVIARSSVNVNHGAKSRLSGLIVSILVVGMVLFLSNFLNMVPISILASILVYTGYKLAAPSNWKKIYKVGKEQFVIFLVTIIATLSSNLTNGILLGVLFTLVMQFILVKDARVFVKSLFKPNVLSYQEGDDKYVIGVKGVSNFANFLRLKADLDKVPTKQHVILDFSLTSFVDNSVMEHVFHYSEDYKSKGGKFEVVGLDIHDPRSSHPFAARRIFKLARLVKKERTLTKRQEDLKNFAKELDWKFKSNSVFDLPELASLDYFGYRVLDHAYNVTRGSEGKARFEFFDIEYSEGELFVKEIYRSSMILIKLDRHIPEFTLDRESLLNRVINLSEKQHIKFTDHKDFSHRFHLESDNESVLRSFFTDELIMFFERNPYYHIESKNDLLLIMKKERIASISEMKQMTSFGRRLTRLLQQD